MSALTIAKKAYAAWDSKDIEALRPLLHEDYRGKMPGGMEIVGIEGAKQCLENCPFECHSENESYIVEGNNVVRIWDMVSTAPLKFRVRMAELSVIQDGKVVFNEAFFDSAAFPKEAQELCDSIKEKMQKEGAVVAGNKN